MSCLHRCMVLPVVGGRGRIIALDHSARQPGIVMGTLSRIRAGAKGIAMIV